MSKFLRHLLQRSLAPAATLQPRLASRFESGPAPARFSEERVETFAAAPDVPPPSRPVASAASSVASPRAEILSTVVSSPLVAASPPVAPPPVIVSAPAPLATSPVPPAANPAPVAPRAEAASFSAPPAVVREVFSLPPASPATLLIERATERIRESSPAPESAVSSSTVASAQVTVPTFTPALLAPIAAPISPATPPSALPVVAPAAPTIRVTIGRVDIRAIHAPSTASVRALAPERRPIVSLETYLSQRDAK